MRVEHEQQPWTLNEMLQRSDIGWHGVRLNNPDWSASSHSIALMARPPNEGMLFHVMLNAYWEPLSFELPPLDEVAQPWRRRIDTFLDTPQDIIEWDQAPEVHGTSYRVEGRSVVILFSNLQP
jgi:glycogen operon protein